MTGFKMDSECTEGQIYIQTNTDRNVKTMRNWKVRKVKKRAKGEFVCRMCEISQSRRTVLFVNKDTSPERVAYFFLGI